MEEQTLNIFSSAKNASDTVSCFCFSHLQETFWTYESQKKLYFYIYYSRNCIYKISCFLSKHTVFFETLFENDNDININNSLLNCFSKDNLQII